MDATIKMCHYWLTPNPQVIINLFFVSIAMCFFVCLYIMISQGCQDLDLVNMTFTDLRHTTGCPGEKDIFRPQCSICLILIHQWDDTLTHTLCKKSIHARCLMRWQLTQHDDARCPFDRQTYKSTIPSHCANEMFRDICKLSLKNPDGQGPCIDCPIEKIEEHFNFLRRAFAGTEMTLFTTAAFLVALLPISFFAIVMTMIWAILTSLYHESKLLIMAIQ